MDVKEWLRSLGLSRYEGAFREAEIGPDVLPDLTDSDLEKLGVPLGIANGSLKRSQVLVLHRWWLSQEVRRQRPHQPTPQSAAS